jgi:DNA topoisomerase-2
VFAFLARAGTGWSTAIPNHNPLDVIGNIERLLDGEEMQPMAPWYRGFQGTIEQVSEDKFAVSGCIEKLNTTTVRINELPVGTWTNTYTELLTKLAEGKQIERFTNLSTDTAVCFEVKLSRKKLREVEEAVGGLHKFFKVQSSISTGKCSCSCRWRCRCCHIAVLHLHQDIRCSP